MEATIGAIMSSQEEMEAEWVYTKRLEGKGMRASVHKQTQIIRDELDMQIQGTRFDVQATNTLIEATRREFGTQQAEAEGRTGFLTLREHIRNVHTHTKLRTRLQFCLL